MNLSLEFFARFYLLALANESKAVEAFESFCINGKIKTSVSQRFPLNTDLIQVCMKVFHKAKKNNNLKTNVFTQEYFKWSPPGPPNKYWIEFCQECDEESFLAVLLHLVMGLSIDVSAKWLNVSTGTLRIRTSKGLNNFAKILNEANSLSNKDDSEESKTEQTDHRL